MQLYKMLLLIAALPILVSCMTLEYHPQSGKQELPQLLAKEAVMADGYRLPFRFFPSSSEAKAVVVGLHGFNDYSQAFDGMCGFLQEQGVACYAYDQRGFGGTQYWGQWPGPGVLEKDLHTWVSLLKQRHPGIPVYVAGESMGGAVIMSAYESLSALSPMSIPEGTILLAPAVWGRETQPWYQRTLLWFAVRLFPEWQPTGKGLGIVATDNNEALKAMGRDPLVIKATRIDAIYGLTDLMDKALNSASSQTLKSIVMYGENDQVIPKEPTCRMLASVASSKQNTRFVLYERGYHMLTRDLQALNLFRDIDRWIESDIGDDEFELGIDLARHDNHYCRES